MVTLQTDVVLSVPLAAKRPDRANTVRPAGTAPRQCPSSLPRHGVPRGKVLDGAVDDVVFVASCVHASPGHFRIAEEALGQIGNLIGDLLRIGLLRCPNQRSGRRAFRGSVAKPCHRDFYRMTKHTGHDDREAVRAPIRNKRAQHLQPHRVGLCADHGAECPFREGLRAGSRPGGSRLSSCLWPACLGSHVCLLEGYGTAGYVPSTLPGSATTTTASVRSGLPECQVPAHAWMVELNRRRIESL